jgi:AraC-like DNA-binding protein
MGIIHLPSADIPALCASILTRAWHELFLTNSVDWLHQMGLHQMERIGDRFSENRILPIEYVHNTRRMLEIKRYLDLNYTEPIRISNLARQYDCDRFYLMRNFRQNFGISPYAYIMDLRETHFIRSILFHQQSSKVIDLALASGFNDYATFYRQFRNRFGRSPSQIMNTECSAL